MATNEMDITPEQNLVNWYRHNDPAYRQALKATNHKEHLYIDTFAAFNMKIAGQHPELAIECYKQIVAKVLKANNINVESWRMR